MATILAACTLVGLFVLFGGMLCLARRGRPRALLADDVVVRHPVWVRAFALGFAFVVPSGITVAAFLCPPRDDGETWSMLGSYALFAALSGPLLWEAMGLTLIVSDDGLLCRSPWRGLRFLRWREVEEVYATRDASFVIRGTTGWKFRVPEMAVGVARFLDFCERHLPWAVLLRARAGYARLHRAFPPPPEQAEAHFECQPRSEDYRAQQNDYRV